MLNGAVISRKTPGGKCPEPWVREEEIDRQFREALGAMKIDERVLNWMVTALKDTEMRNVTTTSNR